MHHSLFLEPFVISKGQVPETAVEEVGTEIQENEAVAEEVLLEQPELEKEKEEVQDNIQEQESVVDKVLIEKPEEKNYRRRSRNRETRSQKCNCRATIGGNKTGS